MNESKNRYFVKNAVDEEFEDISTKFDGVAVLKVDNMLSRGKPINIYTAQWVDSQFEDYMITTMQDGEPKVVRENPDISITFIVRQTYADNPIDVQTVHDDFVGYLTGSDVWIRSDYSGGKIVHGVCLEPYEPTTVSLQRGLKSYIMGTIKLHSLGSVFDYFVSTSLRRVTLSHQDDGIVRNQPYSNSLVYASDNGLVLVTITMGGTDITSTAYNHATKQISIPHVTGNIVISAESSPKIVFADQNVKSLCVTNWGGNYLQGEITEWEAAQVTSLNSVFFRNSQITTFDELRYFTGLTGFNTSTGGQGQFYNCIALTSVILPQLNLDTADLNGLFCVCPVHHVDLTPIKANTYNIHFLVRLATQQNWLKDITFPSGIYVAQAAPNIFANQKGLTTIAIQGTADWSGIPDYRGCFSNCTSLTTITGNIVGINPTTSGINNIDIHWSPLTRSSAMVLINGLAQTSSPKKITFSWATYNLLSDDDIAIANSKGWNVETYVQFEDPNLKTFILEQFSDNVGKTTANEITNLELASITSLDEKFRGLTRFNNDSTKPFTTFNELRFFTGLTSLAYAFYDCTSLSSVAIPKASITDITGAFRMTRLSSLDLSPLTPCTISSAASFLQRSSTSAILTYIKLAGGSYANLNAAFSRNIGLTTIEIDGTANFNTILVGNCLYDCRALANIIGTITGIKVNIDFHWSPLTRASALVVLNGLTQVQTAQKVTFSYSTYNLLTDADIAIATAKNWQVETIIEWEDNNLRDYILAQFPNNVGLTYSGQITNLELASITSLDGKFRGVSYFDEEQTKPFYTFNELKYCTGITSFTRNATDSTQGEFAYCSNLESITLPKVTVSGFAIPQGMFSRCPKLTLVDVTPIKHSDNTYVLYNAFRLQSSNSSLKKVILPEGNYRSTGANAFAFRTGLTTIEIDGIADWSGVTPSSNFFQTCNALTTITGSIIGISIDISFNASPLDHDTALMLLNGLYDLTGGTQQTITFSASTYATLTQEDIAIATNKNWQVASA